MSSSFLKEFYCLIFFTMFFSISIIVFFIPTFNAEFNLSFEYNKPNFSSIYSNQESTLMNKNNFIWPTPRLFNYIV